ncbi:MAG TPA: undecaprenyl-diphosphate phosphatase [Solirubrobacteraceae bacterium]|nr:undecaprenyl-diphosphate phosphatase [Solirubrobacteraceae bacterium]
MTSTTHNAITVLAAAHPITWFQAIVLGLLQGVSELFPVSSLGHTVLFPTLFGWNPLVRFQSRPESPWLAFVVMLHVGSAIGLLIYFWRDWIKIIRAFFATLGKRRIETPNERLAWLIVTASIPTGILGLALEHPIRVALAKPISAAVFLMLNGVILILAERLRRRAAAQAAAQAAAVHDGVPGRARSLDGLDFREAALMGLAQSGGLVPGISRDGMVMSAGLLRGLDNEDSARFSFLLATPIILAAGVFKVSDLTGPLGDGIRGQAVAAAVCAAFAGILSVRYLLRYFESRNLIPFGIYCLIFGGAMVLYTALT